MNSYTVDYLENEIRELEAIVEGLGQERTELEGALGRLQDAVYYTLETWGLASFWLDAGEKETVANLMEQAAQRLTAALEDEGCGSTE